MLDGYVHPHPALVLSAAESAPQAAAPAIVDPLTKFGNSCWGSGVEPCFVTGCLQLLEILEISWNFIDASRKFNCQLKYGNMPIAEPNLVTPVRL